MSSTATAQSFSSDGRTLRAYFEDIGRTPLLTPEEERELTRRKRSGDMRAFRRLVESNLRFVVTIAKKHQNQGVPLEDLISEGNIGLIRAAEHFDLKFGVRFISYAVWWIKQAMTASLHEQRNVVHIPFNRALEHTRATKAEVELQQTLGRNPTRYELATKMHTTVGTVSRIQQTLPAYVSMDAPVGDDEQRVVGDFIGDPEAQPEEDRLLERALRGDLMKAVETLDPKEQVVLQLRFGLLDGEAHTLEEVGRRLRLSRERIRQIEEKALRRLRNPLRNPALQEHVLS